jgi:hypothetical protein
MNSPIVIVGWDADRVMYNDLITSICAKGSRLDSASYLKDFVEEKKWFTYDDVHRWENQTGKKVETVGYLADMLTDFLYKMKKVDGSASVTTKQQTIEGKQAILKCLTIGDIQKLSVK